MDTEFGVYTHPGSEDGFMHKALPLALQDTYVLTYWLGNEVLAEACLDVTVGHDPGSANAGLMVGTPFSATGK